MAGRMSRTSQLWHDLMRTQGKIRRATRQLLGPLGIKGPSVPALRLIGQAGDDGLRLTDLAEGMTVSPAYITRLVDRLEANGFVQRGPDPGDRRALRVVLTARGTEVEAEMRPIMAKFSDELLSALTKTEQAQLQDYLQRLAGRAHELARQTREAE